jgi:hypothetical protein
LGIVANPLNHLEKGLSDASRENSSLSQKSQYSKIIQRNAES